ncbi:MAG: L-rhamnose mutarotase [Pseudomonadales bacterium]
MNDTRRQCFALDLVDDADLIAEYERYHKPDKIWPAITASIRKAGIVDMEIYRVGDRLFMIMEVTPEFDPAAKTISDSNDPDVIAWEKLMWRFQQPLPSAEEGEKWLQMKRIFSLTETPDDVSGG